MLITVSLARMQTNNGYNTGRKTQTYELKIHLALKINNRGRSTHTNKINVIRTHQKIQPNNYNTIFVKQQHMQATKIVANNIKPETDMIM